MKSYKLTGSYFPKLSDHSADSLMTFIPT